MLILSLDPTDDCANPAFKDATACAQWLGQLQLTDLHHAHGVLRMQLDEFNRYPIRGIERLHTLELLRETVSSVQADYARKLVAKNCR
jgi:cyclic-di-GMP-binding protein